MKIILTSVCVILFVLFGFYIFYTIKKERKVTKDISGRAPCSLDRFLKEGKIEPLNDKERRFIEVARKVMAELGTVPENSIYPTDTFHDEIGFLPFWNSIDMLEYIAGLEEALDMDIDSVIDWPYPDYSPQYTVAEFFNELLILYRKRSSSC